MVWSRIDFIIICHCTLFYYFYCDRLLQRWERVRHSILAIKASVVAAGWYCLGFAEPYDEIPMTPEKSTSARSSSLIDGCWTWGLLHTTCRSPTSVTSHFRLLIGSAAEVVCACMNNDCSLYDSSVSMSLEYRLLRVCKVTYPDHALWAYQLDEII